MKQEAENLVRTCSKYQIYTNEHHLLTNQYHIFGTPIPFAQWGTQLLGPFLKTLAGKNHLIVAIDDFTNWIEVKALAVIRAKKG